MYDAIDGDDIFDVLLINGDSFGLDTDDPKRFFAARQELVICVGGELVCILIFGRDKWRSIKEYLFTQFANWCFVHTAVIILFVMLLRLFCMDVYFRSQSSYASFSVYSEDSR